MIYCFISLKKVSRERGCVYLSQTNTTETLKDFFIRRCCALNHTLCDRVRWYGGRDYPLRLLGNRLFLPVSQKFKRLPSGRIQYKGESFPGFNKPKRAPKDSKKKFVVLAKQGDKIKKISYGHRDYQDFRQHKDPKRRKNFRARHNCKTAKDKTTARYWACKHLW